MRELTNEIIESFKAFFDGRLDASEADEAPEIGLPARVQKCKGLLNTCEKMCAQCDPALQMVPGTRTPFPKLFYDSLIGQMRLVISDLDMLILALQGHTEEHFLGTHEPAKERDEQEKLVAKQADIIWAHMAHRPAFAIVRQDAIDTLTTVFGVITAVLEHTTEEPLNSLHVNLLNSTTQLSTLEGLDEFYDQVSKETSSTKVKDEAIFEDKRVVSQLRRTRILVATNALSLMVKHTEDLSAKCFQNMIYF